MRRSALIGSIVFAIALAALLLLRSGSALHPPYPKQQATRAALADPQLKLFLEQHAWTRARVIALDEQSWRVTFTDGPRYIADAAVGPGGQVVAAEFHDPDIRPPGAHTLWIPAVLVALAALFVLAVAVVPLRSLRNLDAVVIAVGFTLAMLLLDARLYGWQTWIGAITLAYIAVRCGSVAFRSRPERKSAPAYQRVLARTNSDRTLALIGAALFVAGVVLTVTSTGPSDVAGANLAGATLLNHGTSPYGHATDVAFHGDTYPLLSYVLYMPFAAISPVHDAFDSLDGALWLNALALAVATFAIARAWGRDHVVAWLAFPPLLIAASGGGNDVPTATFVVVALVFFARPLVSSALIVLSGWVKIVPAVALIPLAASVARQTRVRMIGMTVALIAAGLLALIAIGGTSAVSDMYHALRFQLERGSWFSVWQQAGVRPLQPMFQAAVAGGAAAGAIELWRSGTDVRRVAAFAGALVALLQLSANYWTYAYLPWLLPFILVALFPPARRRSPQPAPPAP